MPAHHALQAGELDDGLADEVGLAQVRGALRGLRARLVEACLLADGGGEFLDARRLVLHTAELLGKDDIGQLVHVAFQRHALVFVHEKLRVGQTRAHDALVALGDGGIVGRVAVRDDDEGIVKRAVGAIHGEVALMLQHGVADNLGRHLQKLLVEMAQQRRRPFHEIHHLGKGAGRRVGRQPRLGLNGRNLFADNALALGGARHDLHLGIGACQRVGISHLKGAVYHEAVPARRAPGDKTRVLDGHDRIAQQAQQPAYGTREGHMPATPALRLGPRHPRDQPGQKLRQQLCRGTRRLVDGRVDVLRPALVGTAHQLGRIHALAAGKSDGGLRGISRLVKGDGGGRPARLLAQLGARGGHVFYRKEDTARCRAGRDFAVRDAGGVQRVCRLSGQLFGGRIQRGCGDFLGANLEDEGARIGVCARACSGARSRVHVLAHSAAPFSSARASKSAPPSSPSCEAIRAPPSFTTTSR